MSRERSPRLNKEPEELFWEKKGYKQCLWSYFVTVKKGKPLKKSDFDLVWSVFNSIEEDSNTRYADVVVDKKGRTKNNDLIVDLSDEANKIMNAKSMKELKKVFQQIKAEEYTTPQREYLRKLINGRKDTLKEKAD